MSRSGMVLSFERTTDDEGSKISVVKVDVGGDYVNVDHHGPAGDDSPPMPGDFAALSDAAGAGEEQAVGYLDPLTSPVATEGEKRLYSRSAPGVTAAVIWLKADGSVVVSNIGGGSIEMAASGDVTINGVVIDTLGNVSAPGDVQALSEAVPVSLATHVHTSAAPSNPTSGPIPAP